MVTLFGIFDVGARALLAQQLGLNVTGNNIANANTEGYSRQRVNFVTSDPLNVTPGAIPTGVRVDSIERVRDQFLDFQVRAATTEQGFLDKNSDILGELQVMLQDPLNPLAELLEENPAESGLNALLSRFFGAFQELSANPESIAVRATVRETAITLARGLNALHSGLSGMAERLNQQVSSGIAQMNGIFQRIASLNQEIVRVEANPQNNANDLRDMRDNLLNQLAQYAPITVTEQPNGQVDVRILGTGVVIGSRVAPLEAITDPEDPTGKFEIINSIERSRILTEDLDTGILGSLIQARDELVPGLIGQIDTLAKTIIREVNNIHTGAIGFESFSEITGTISMDDPNGDLEDLDLDFPPAAGSFVIRVVDQNNVVQNLYTINFDPTVDSLNDLAAQIDAIDGAAGPGAGSISAAVTAGNQLQITANGGLKFTFQGDTSHVLTALGINTFFSGNDAESMQVSESIMNSESGLRRIAASATGASGDNGASLQLAALQNALVADGNTTTVGDSYRRMIAELGVRAQRNTTELNASDTSLLDLKSRQESVSGVSLDEESINLIRFQQAFNAAARYITTVDTLIDRVVNGLGATR